MTEPTEQQHEMLDTLFNGKLSVNKANFHIRADKNKISSRSIAALLKIGYIKRIALGHYERQVFRK